MKSFRIIVVITVLVAVLLIIAPMAAFVFPSGTTFRSLYLKNTIGSEVQPASTDTATPTPTITATKTPVPTRSPITFKPKVTPTKKPVITRTTRTPTPSPTPTPQVTATPAVEGSSSFRDRYGGLLQAGSKQTPVTPSVKVLPTQIDPGWDSSGRLPAGWKYDPDTQMLYPPGWEEWDMAAQTSWLVDSGNSPQAENWKSVWS